MDLIGCSSPFLPFKDHICTDEESGNAANLIFEKAKKVYHGKCLYPCQYLQILLITTHEKPWNNPQKLKFNGKPVFSRITLVFQPAVKKTTAYYSYGTLSLFAEVGGYLGLLLGYSLHNIREVVDIFYLKLIKSI